MVWKIWANENEHTVIEIGKVISNVPFSLTLIDIHQFDFGMKMPIGKIVLNFLRMLFDRHTASKTRTYFLKTGFLINHHFIFYGKNKEFRFL
jgi:hypothetical protein